MMPQLNVSQKEEPMTRQSSTGHMMLLVPALVSGLQFTQMNITLSGATLPGTAVPALVDPTWSARGIGQLVGSVYDVADEGVTSTDLAAWGNSMIGGDISDMLNL
jgi:hypothetical protein